MMQQFNFIFTVGIVVTLFGPIANAQSASDKVKAYLANEMEKQKIPGLQIVVIYQGKVVLSEALGIANFEFSVPTSKHTIFSINSITKVFTATSILQLVEEDKIDIEMPISKYLDNLPSNWRSVTVKQLLSHTSGLPNIEDSITGELIGNKGQVVAWEKVKTLALLSPPGEKFSYNATNYILLGKILDKYGKLPFEKYIQKHQLDLVEMKETIYGNSFDVIKNKAPTYTYFYQDKDTGESIKGNQLLQVYEDFPTMLRTDAGMFSTAEEIAKWIIALQNNLLLKYEKNIKMMWTPVKLNNGQIDGFGGILNGYALGWPVAVRKDHPAVAAVGGGRAALMIYPDDNLCIILLTNLSGCSPELTIEKIAEFYFK